MHCDPFKLSRFTRAKLDVGNYRPGSLLCSPDEEFRCSYFSENLCRVPDFIFPCPLCLTYCTAYSRRSVNNTGYQFNASGDFRYTDCSLCTFDTFLKLFPLLAFLMLFSPSSFICLIQQNIYLFLSVGIQKLMTQNTVIEELTVEQDE